jgi:hypothetical protein
MSFVRYSVGVAFLLGATACGSSSSPAAASAPDSSTDDSTAGDAGTMPAINATCGLLSGIGGGGTAGTCPMGQTCCTTIVPPGASCVPPTQCTGMSISNQCSKASDCAAGQICCAGDADGGAPDAGALLMMVATDAAAGGAGALAGIDFSMFNTTCQTSCMGPQTQECSMDSECPSGMTCQAPAGAGGLGAFAGLLMLPKTCAVAPPDAGTTPVTDSGTTTPVVDAAPEAASTPPADAASE